MGEEEEGEEGEEKEEEGEIGMRPAVEGAEQSWTCPP